MPLYNYECPRHGEFSGWASLADYDKGAPCPSCGKLSRRSVSTAYLAMDSQLRRAMGSSEKSAHEPRVVRRRRGDPIPAHDAHSDLSKVRTSAHGRGHGHTHDHSGGKATVHSRHPWLVRH
jgi:putative FmdB family regulatory protein